MSVERVPYLCFCNKVFQDEVQRAIDRGARNLSEIYDVCGAGTGPCGGSCRKKILSLLASAQRSASSSALVEEVSVVPDGFVEAVSLFNRRYYWETHEVLEDLWMVEQGERRLFYQGIIQAAAALYHVLNANPKGVIKLAEESVRKLLPYAPSYMDLNLDELISSIENYLSQAKEILGGSRSGFDYDALPYLRMEKIMDKERPGS